MIGIWPGAVNKKLAVADTMAVSIDKRLVYAFPKIRSTF